MKRLDSKLYLAQKAANITTTIDLDALLARFQIDGITKENLAKFMPLLMKDMDKHATRFYDYIRHFTELQSFLANHDIEKLRRAQTSYWTQLFRCQFNLAYVHSAVLIGLTHRKIGLPAYLYLAGYNFFQNELYRTVSATLKPLEFVALSISINKVIAVDIAIALHAYHNDIEVKDMDTIFTMI